MKYLWGSILTLLLFSSFAKSATPEIRQKIGNIFTAPLLYNEKYYFVSTAGILYESNKDLSEVTSLYSGTRQTIGVMTLVNDKLFWGDGLHTDQKTTLHVYDLKAKALLKDIELDGHINRAPLVQAGLIILPLGPSGIVALDLKTFSLKWKTESYGNKKIHVDSNLVVVEDKVCGTSVGDTKGLFCVKTKTGVITQFSQLMRDPKSDITVWKNHLVGYATEGDIARAKFDIPSDLFIYDVKADKIILSKELRGFSYFPPSIQDDEAFITLSTGDFLLLNLTDGIIFFIGEYPEPFINNPFRKDGEYCGIGIMGKYMCFKRTKAGLGINLYKSLNETVLGRVSVWDSKILAPTKTGYYLE